MECKLKNGLLHLTDCIMKYLFVCSEDSVDLNPANATYDFTISLPQELNGKFKIALGEITYTSHFEDLYVFCDLCEHSYIKDTSLPILRIVPKMGEFQNLYFHSVTRSNIQRIRIFITNSRLETPSQDVGPIRCTLLLLPI